MFPADTARWLLSNDGAAIIAAALQGLHLEGTGSPPAALQQHLLSAVNTALAAEPSLSTSSAELGQLLSVLRSVGLNAEDAGVASAASEAAERLGSTHPSI